MNDSPCPDDPPCPPPAPRPDQDAPRDQDEATWFEQARQILAECEPTLRSVLRHRLRNSEDIDDCVQNTFLKLVTRGRNLPPAARRSWVFRVAANEAALFWRKERRETEARESLGRRSDRPQTDDAEAALLARDSFRQAGVALERLPEPTRQVIRLRIECDLSFEQIAKRLNIPLGTALTRMHRGLSRLRSILQSDQTDG